jgi:hypothetical protein
MTENKIRHLEMIQKTITRMSGNLFVLKGWTITLIIGLLTVAVKNDWGIFVMFSCFSILIFWILDGYFLSMERCYRDLFNSVRKKEDKKIDFSMDFKKFMKGKNTWIRSIFSKTLIIFYGTLSIIVFAVTLTMKINNVSIIIDINNISAENRVIQSK